MTKLGLYEESKRCRPSPKREWGLHL